MSTRYRKVFSLSENWYIKTSPVVIRAGALLWDSEDQRLVGQLKIQNICDKTIIYLKASLTPQDAMGREIGEPIEKEYLDLQAKRDAYFGSQSPIEFPVESARSFSVRVVEVGFSDRTMWDSSDSSWNEIPKQQPIDRWMTERHQLKGFQEKFGDQCINVPLVYEDIWLCSCGKTNHCEEERCVSCGVSLSQLLSADPEALGNEVLRKEEEARLAREREAELARQKAEMKAARQAELRKIKAEQNKIKAEQNKKKAIKAAKIGIPSLLALVLVVVLTVTLFIPMLRFNKADKLFAEGKYDEANQIYKELDGFGDSNQRISIVKAIDKLEEKKLEDGIETLLTAGVPVELTYRTKGGSLTETQTVMVGHTLSLDNSIVSLNAEEEVVIPSAQNVFTFTQISDFTGLKVPGRNGYRFLEWVLDTYSYDVEAKDAKFCLTLKATWSTKDYVVEYDLAGGSMVEPNVAEYDPEDEAFTLINPTRVGYTFAGWTGTDLTEPTINVTVPTGSYGDRKYIANWQAISTIITLNPNGGSCTPITIPVTYNEEFTLPDCVWKEHIFSGWYMGDTKITSGICQFTEDITLVAEWNIIQYSITYTLNGGTNADTNLTTYNYHDAFTLAVPTKKGYTFLGWTFDGQDIPVKNVSVVAGTTGEKFYTANWQANTYTITFDANGGIGIPASDEVEFDTNVTLPTPTRVGYTFDGWFVGSTPYETGLWVIDEHVTLVAKWTARTDIPYVVNHYLQNANDDGYTKESTRNFTGTADASITPDVKTYTYFVSPMEKTVTIAPDGTLVVDYYYNRVTYDFIYGGNMSTGCTASTL